MAHLIAGNVQLAITGWLLLGAIPGIYLGARLSINTPSVLLKWILGVLLLGTGLKLWSVSTSATLVICAVFAITAVGRAIYKCPLRSDTLRSGD